MSIVFFWILMCLDRNLLKNIFNHSFKMMISLMQMLYFYIYYLNFSHLYIQIVNITYWHAFDLQTKLRENRIVIIFDHLYTIDKSTIKCCCNRKFYIVYCHLVKRSNQKIQKQKNNPKK